MRAHTPALTERQLALINLSANSLPPTERDRFRAYVADHLTERPSDTAVTTVINTALDWLTWWRA